MRIGIVAKTHRADFADLLKSTLRWLKERGCETVVEQTAVEEFGLREVRAATREQITGEVDAIIVFGGDGTLLSVARLIKDHRPPILGVNLGSLGFMTGVTLEELGPALERLLANDYRVSRRCMLKVKLERHTGEIDTFQALNDAVVNKGTLARIISLDAYSGEDFIANFLADGIIVATPTGSTAYSLSAGGPIIFPTQDLITLTPICPHTLTNRPVIIPAENEVRVVLREGEDVMATIDGQVGVKMREGDVLSCTRSENYIELIQTGEKTFFDILREKLKWGER